ncbi:MAG: precorrin-2 C(20)-methyltransferase [Rhodobacteraceae bacterium]|nr:precorrin-2 C(20)-methyltransferase [Paracoccaceae bacterium]
MAHIDAGHTMEIHEVKGRLYGVGLGPGDPELLTLKAARLIRSAKFVAYPEPEGGESFARSIAADFIAGGAVEIPIPIPMDESRFPAQRVYDRAAAEISEVLRSGSDVVAICQGDPFFYGSFMYLFSRLTERYSVSIVPGVSSLAACAAVAARPLCARIETLSVLPAPMPAEELERRLRVCGAAAIIKLGRHMPKVKSVLRRLDLFDNSVFVAHATLPTQRVEPLATSPEAAPYLSMILIPGSDPYGSA